MFNENDDDDHRHHHRSNHHLFLYFSKLYISSVALESTGDAEVRSHDYHHDIDDEGDKDDDCDDNCPASSNPHDNHGHAS